MLKPRPYLFELIASLTKGEVAAFKRYIKHRHGFEGYIRLFDYLRRRSEYDEEKLKKDLRSEAIVGYLAVSKNYLYNTILQFLGAPGGDDKEKDLYFRLMAVKKLMDKCLYHHALRIVRKTRKKALEQENFKVLLELLELEKMNCRQILDRKSFSETLQSLVAEESVTLKKVNQLMALQHLYDQISVIDKDQSRGEEARALLEGSVVMEDYDLLLSTRSRTYYWRIRAQVKLRCADFAGLVVDLEACVELIEGHEAIRADRIFFQGYLEVLFNLGHAYILVGRIEGGKAITEKLIGLESDDEGKIRILERQMIIEMSIAQQVSDWESGSQLIRRISENLEAYQGRFHKAKELTLCYGISHYLITMGKPSEANKWLQALQAGQFSDYRMDYQCFAELLFLVVQYELGNLEGLAYYHTNTRNRLYRRNRLGPLEKRILKLFRQLSNENTQTSVKELLLTCKEEIELIYETRENAALIHYFDFVEWLEATLRGKPMYQVRIRDQV